MCARVVMLIWMLGTLGCKGMPCRADCECIAALGQPEDDNTLVACIRGHCTRSAAEPGGGSICQGGWVENWPNNCACRGGTCDSRGCCILADGEVAPPDSDVCLPLPCRADCECLAALPSSGGDTCVAGQCLFAGSPTTGLCGDLAPKEWPVWCACTVGTCDERNCCVQADGTVAMAGETPCLPADGG